MRGLRWLLVVAVVLGVLLVVADRVGVWIAERTVADQVAAELADNQIDSAPPEVSIRGVPFLTQVGGGRYEEVVLVLREVGADQVRLSQVELVATGVTATVGTLTSGEGSIDAERVEGTGTIGYADVAALAGLDGLELGPAPDGAMSVRLPTELLNESVVLVGTAQLAVADGVVGLSVEDLSVEESPSGVPPGGEDVVDELRLRLSLDVPLPALPYDLTVEAVRAEPAGLVVDVSATDVPIAR